MIETSEEKGRDSCISQTFALYFLKQNKWLSGTATCNSLLFILYIKFHTLVSILHVCRPASEEKELFAIHSDFDKLSLTHRTGHTPQNLLSAAEDGPKGLPLLVPATIKF